MNERQACSEICVAKNIQVALLVESSLASDYAFVAALSQSTVATFSWDEVNAAFAHLGVVGPAAASALAALRVAGEPIAA